MKSTNGDRLTCIRRTVLFWVQPHVSCSPRRHQARNLNDLSSLGVEDVRHAVRNGDDLHIVQIVRTPLHQRGPLGPLSITRHLSSRSEYVASLPHGAQPQSGTDVFLQKGDVEQIQRSVREQCHDAVRWLRG
jgi:hypothetical protein